jgi:hypothetical protein
MCYFGPLWIHVPKNKALGCIQITNRCTTNPCKFEHPHVKWECTLMINRHTSILASSNTPTNEALGGHSVGQ